MGIYTLRGLEYRIVLDRNVTANDLATLSLAQFNAPGEKFVVLLDQARTDARLLQSSYYRGRQQDWKQSAVRPSTSHVLAHHTLPLTDKEQEAISCALQHFGESVEEYGWYDVVRHDYFM